MSSNSASNQIGFTPGSPHQNVATSANQSQISPPQSHRHSVVPQNHQKTAAAQPAIASSATASIPLLMGGEHSAFRALNPSTTAALLAASAQLGLARSYAASLVNNNNNNNNSNNNNNIASSTSTNQSPPVSPQLSESDEEINVHDAESDTETSNASKRNSRLDYKTPLELTKRN